MRCPALILCLGAAVLSMLPVSSNAGEPPAAKRPIVVIAHRGEHLSHVENTLPAFQAAIEAGADYFECDVRTTADGHMVLVHDATVDRTTNGKGHVSELAFDQVRALDARGNRVPTFEEA